VATGSTRDRRTLEALVDTNVLVRHLTGDPPAQARRATAFLGAGHVLILLDVVLAELVYVLSSYYGRSLEEVATAARSLLALSSIAARDVPLLLRALELFEAGRMDFQDAYLVAAAERTGVRKVASFDRDLGAVPGVERISP
jgi:predicted nucleic acid-binding protein